MGEIIHIRDQALSNSKLRRRSDTSDRARCGNALELEGKKDFEDHFWQKMS
jgi:hypothetical protein